MRSLRESWYRVALVVFCVLGLTILTGCPCKECPGGVHKCDECPTCPEGKHVNVGVPVPGPIIDTTGGTGSLIHRYDEIAITGSSGDTDQIDNRLLTEIVSAVLVDTASAKVAVETTGKILIICLLLFV